MSVSRFFDHPRVRQGLTIALVCGALTCMFPPQAPAFLWWAAQVSYITAGYVALGVFFLLIDQPRLMFVCLGCSAAICLFQIETQAAL